MKVKRTSLNEELSAFQETQTTPSRKLSPPLFINYDLIIEKQSQLIQSLYKQCTALRQKINRLKSEEIFSSQNKHTTQNNMEKFALMIENDILKQIATLLEIPQSQITKNKVLQFIKRLKWQRQKKSEPIFIESKKQVRVPVPVEIQKIVYKEKIVVQQKIVEVPVFRQKIVEKFSKIQQIQIFPSTVSKLSQGDQKVQNSSGLEKSDDSLFLGTQSVVKQIVKKEVSSRQQSRKNSTKMQEKSQIFRQQKSQIFRQQKSQIYRGQKNWSKDYGNGQKMTLSDIRQDQGNMNLTQYYDPNSQKLNSRLNKQNMHSPKYQKNNYRQTFNKYDYNQQEQIYQHRNNNYDKGQNKEYYRNSNEHNYRNSNEHNYRNSNEHNYRNSNEHNYRNSKEHNNGTIISPKNYLDKYRDDMDKYGFDKNKFLDHSKINPGNKNIKRRDKYDFNDYKYRDR